MPEVDVVEMLLPPLSRMQTRTLIRNLLGKTDVEPQVLRAIETRSEGNPFFTEEIVRHLTDSGSLRRGSSGVWGAESPGGRLAIPNTLQGVIRARIDQLPEAAKQQLLRASVIGRSFSQGLLRLLEPAGDADFERNIGYLLKHQLIFEKKREPEAIYAFKHALVQAEAYESLLPRRRRELHRQVARVVEESLLGRGSDVCGILAYHYSKAEDWEAAQDYLRKAGDYSARSRPTPRPSPTTVRP